jgi:hypothetical protein
LPATQPLPSNARELLVPDVVCSDLDAASAVATDPNPRKN